ncbi:Poly-beta-1,6-N-acetyl-D-glucosamine N-deacetylase [bacterium HR25]|nr:Poly-beta-1,6-N-acetyl-D-glucosamine N-deacetylase [bacterium HR25]
MPRGKLTLQALALIALSLAVALAVQAGPAPVELALSGVARQRQRWRLEGGLETIVSVRDALNGQPIATAAFAAVPSTVRLTVVGREDGTYSLRPSADATLLVHAPGYEQQAMPLARGQSSLLVSLSPTPRAVADRFLRALATGSYQDAWNLLSAEARGLWPGPEPFVAFLQAKLAGRSLSYALGEEEERPAWADPDSGRRRDVHLVYADVTAGEEPSAHWPRLPLALVREDGAWRVLWPGPAARRGPILPPRQPPQRSLRVPIFIYHHVLPSLPAEGLRRSLSVSIPQLEEQLAYLQARGYQTVSLVDLFNALYYGLPLPPRPVILTFDDGYDDAYAHAFPLLKRYGFTATFAVVTGFLGQPGYLTWEQVREMAEAGMEIVSHTAHHVDLAAAPPEQARQELRESRAALEEALGRPVQLLVYPYGEPFTRAGSEARERVVRLVREEGYVGALAALGGLWPLEQRPDNVYRLYRLGVSPGMPLSRFAALLEGHES